MADPEVPQSTYTQYLNDSVETRQAALSQRREDFMQKMIELREKNAETAQQLKNYSGPVVSGSGASLSNKTMLAGALGSISATGGKASPIKGARISQNWGKSNIKYAAGRHTGMDFAAPVGTTVYSAARGTVIRVGSEGAYGNTVHVRQADGTTAVYAHLSGAGVRVGQKVKAGQGIAKSGNTGRSTGAHLHFEVRTRDRYGSDVNANAWLARR